MKKGLLVLFLILGLARLCFADVTAEIIGKDIDENGNIRIKTQYKIDGVEVSSRYPPENGKYYWVTRYTSTNFAGMTKLQIAQRIVKDIKAFADSLIQKKYYSIANPALSNSTLFDTIVGQKLTETTASILVDTNGDNKPDTEYLVKTDGTKTEQPYTPPTP